MMSHHMCDVTFWAHIRKLQFNFFGPWYDKWHTYLARLNALKDTKVTKLFFKNFISPHLYFEFLNHYLPLSLFQ
jgi:hypothetical protein